MVGRRSKPTGPRNEIVGFGLQVPVDPARSPKPEALFYSVAVRKSGDSTPGTFRNISGRTGRMNEKR